MSTVDSAPCRHGGAPKEEVVQSMIRLLASTLAADEDYLQANGLTAVEYNQGLSAAIERIRGSMAARNQDRRGFVEKVLQYLAKIGAITNYTVPQYGDNTVYKLKLKTGKFVGIVQKGCPDGRHSSVAWSRPKWADELYLWWVCDSKTYQPGEHIWKGVNRIRGKVSEPGADQLDGVIFYNQLCGTAHRPCPKMGRAVTFEGSTFPPPCIYVFPHWRDDTRNLNWHGEIERIFPKVVMEAFGIGQSEVNHYIGYVGFRTGGASSPNTEVTCRFGPAKTTTARA